ncbi:PEP-CTERM sorting domain-containing protein [Roseisolibacter sp. H3M3-2]|uniref:PEP-CTERM sorting domain-containing protein n=1 Tax=Roseisolibacter sp. H3M3-2 TaxID=3031323 RepID=UPI0023DA73C0|nr:PEP-CTERM sorting domain-containing protein [Roseisolibacter sp. H3M3-2]MDF1505913.1 PEP-CTERM sorting domain-containing protein [Roseisolibacter sp. H3M3-2]
MPSRPALRRAVAVALAAVLAALPTRAEAQTITYRFDGSVSLASGAVVPVAFTLSGTVDQVTPTPAGNGFLGLFSSPLTGTVTLGADVLPVTDWATFLVDEPESSLLQRGLYFLPGTPLDLALLLTDGLFDTYDLRTAVAPRTVAVTTVIASSQNPTGSGTFQVTLDGQPPVNVVPEPSTYALTAGGLLVLGVWRRRATGAARSEE